MRVSIYRFARLLFMLLPVAPGVVGASCELLTDLRIPHTAITLAKPVPAGEFSAPDGQYAGRVLKVPNFCRVRGVSKPTANSHIQFEVWLPQKDWSGRYYQMAMGGAAGSIDYPSLALGLNAGDAVATTDTGHEGSILEWSWALNQPEKIIDFGYRAHKETSDIARKIVQMFYGEKPHHAYFSGCSRGGHAGFVAAQRYPEDWDGIVIGAAPDNLLQQFRYYTWRGLLRSKAPEGYVPPAKLPAIQRVALASCPSEAQVVDGVAGDPRFCRYDPRQLLCDGPESDECLTAPQVELLRRIYEGPVDERKGEAIYAAGLPPTIEAVKTFMSADDERDLSKAIDFRFIPQFFGSFVFDDLNWKPAALSVDQVWNLGKDKQIAGEPLEAVLSAENIDWRRFRDQGSKVMLYYGWADMFVPAELAIDHYRKVREQVGNEQGMQDFYRLFLAPGMGHCLGGPGANAFGQFNSTPPLTADSQHDIYRALEAWVESGKPPDKIIATKYIDDKPEKGVAFTRPLCPYPEVAVYKGRGDSGKAAYFECRK